MIAVSRLGALLLALLLAFTMAEARTRKGEKLVKEGEKLENQKDYDGALRLYEQALATDFSDPEYILRTRKLRFLAGQTHVENGQKLRNQGKLEEALAEFQKAFAIDPSSGLAETEAKRTYQMIQKERKTGAPAKSEERGVTPVQQARREIEERMASLRSVPELKPLNPQITNLKMTNQNTRVLFETVCKLAGINVLFDPDFISQAQGRNYSLDLTNSTIEEALDYVSLVTKAFWKPISQNAIFVTQDQVTKRRDYEDNVVRVFYLQNVTVAQELNEIAAALRAVTEIRRLLQYTSQMAIMVRGTADQVALAEKLIADLDKPRPEVVIDVIVMEANRVKTRELAATIVNAAGTPGLNVPITFTPNGQTPSDGNGDGDGDGDGNDTPTTPAGTVTLAQLGRLSTNDWSIAVPGGVVKALLNDRTTRVLQNPQLRTLDTVKATLKIGDRYPYATGSFQPGVGTVGVSPLVSTQFQFAEIGTNLDILPKVHPNGDVTLHVEVELSNIADRINVGGLEQPVIGQRKVLEDVRLKEGEVSVVGGLSGLTQTRSSAGLPGLATLPGVGWLFGAQASNLNKSELLVVLIPRIVRHPDINEVNLRTISAGNEQTVRLSYAPRQVAAAPTPGQTKPQAPVAPEPAAPKPVEPAKPDVSTQPQLVFTPGQVQAKAGAPVTVTLEARNMQDLFSAPFRIGYDAKLLRLTEITRGSLMGGENQPVSFTRDVNTGVVRITRLPGMPGISGSGALVTLTFQALAPGAATVTVEEPILQDSKLQPVNATVTPLSIKIE